MLRVSVRFGPWERAKCRARARWAGLNHRLFCVEHGVKAVLAHVVYKGWPGKAIPEIFMKAVEAYEDLEFE